MRFSAEESQFVEMTHCVWLEKFSDSRGRVVAVCLVASYRRRLILFSNSAKCNGRRYNVGTNILVRPVDAFSSAGAGAAVGVDTNANVGVGNSDDDGENDGTGSLGVARPEGETSLRSNLLCRSPRSASMSMLKSRAAVWSRTSRSIFSLET